MSIAWVSLAASQILLFYGNNYMDATDITHTQGRYLEVLEEQTPQTVKVGPPEVKAGYQSAEEGTTSCKNDHNIRLYRDRFAIVASCSTQQESPGVSGKWLN